MKTGVPNPGAGSRGSSDSSTCALNPGLAPAFVDELAAAPNAVVRAEMIFGVLQELDDAVRRLVRTKSFPELASLQLVVAAGERHVHRSTSWELAGQARSD